jgi:hypothetical protein
MIPSCVNKNLTLQKENINYIKEFKNISKTHSQDDDDDYISKVEEVNNLIESSLYNTIDSNNIPGCEQLSTDKLYYYQALECLNTNINDLYTTIYGGRIHVCLYSVNTNAVHPFLEFLLVKNMHHDIEADILMFPMFLYYKDLNMDILDESNRLQKLLLLNTENSIFKGYLMDENNSMNDIYLFYELDSRQIDYGHGELYRNNLLWKVTIDEMVNSRLVCNFPVDDSVTFFFVKNMQFMFLYKYNDNDNNLIYETPTVVYHGVEESLLYFKYLFGVSKMSNEEIMGPFYYFTDYNNAIKMSVDSYINKYHNSDTHNSDTHNSETGKKLGIIRSVIFLGINKVPMNYPEDPHDESYSNSILTAIDNNNANTNRISDRDGIWSNNYDSVYLGKLLLDNGQLIKGTPLWIVKNYDQQVSLSYHYLSSKIVKEDWSENKQYYIL